MSPRVAAALLTGCLLAAAVLLLSPVPLPGLDVLQDAVAGLGESAGLRGLPLEAAVEVLANVAVFAVLAALMCRALPGLRPLVVAVALLGASVGVEVVQALALAGREPSVRDVLANGCGAVLGVLLARRR